MNREYEKQAQVERLARDCVAADVERSYPTLGAIQGNTTLAVRRDIGWAVKQLHNGSLVAREGWNGRGMFLALQRPDAHSKMTLPYVFMHTADSQRVPWLCSQTDLLATDWQVVG